MQQPKSAELKRVVEIAKEAGIEGMRYDPDTERLMVSLNLDDGRHQYVYISEGPGSTMSGGTITVSSPCLHDYVPNVFLDHPDLCFDLLQRNANLSFARYAMERKGEECRVSVMSDQLVETMQAAELQAMINSVARYADELEREFNKDVY